MYIVGQTIPIKCTYRNDSGTLTEPGTPVTITINQPDGTTDVDAENCTQESTGIYYYNYTPSVAGRHWFQFATSDGDLEEGDFSVKASNL